MATSFTNYNGKTVINDEAWKARLTGSAEVYNNALGTNLTAEQYDRQINPTTAGARWGDPDPNPEASAALGSATTQKLTDWYSNLTAPKKSASAALPTTSAATATTATTAPKTSTAGPGYDVSAWYRQAAGREGDAGGLDYWRDQLTQSGDPSAVYSEFLKGLAANGDYSTGANLNNQPAQLDIGSLYTRNPTSSQTVSSQLGSLLDSNGKYIQSARDRAMLESNARGLSNSSIAASAGEDAAIQAALPIATSDAQLYRDVDSYNAALRNQGLMYNTDAQNTYINSQQQINANAAINTQNNATSTKNNAANNATTIATNAANNANQLTLAQLQSETSRYQADKSNASSQYNTDANVKNQAEQNKTTLVNNIIQSTELSPDRKAELLRQLGEEGLASAIFVGAGVSDDLDFSQGY